MIELICYFFPSVLCLWLFESFTRQKLSLKRCIYRFCGNAVIINLFCFALNTYLIKAPVTLTFTTAFYYLVMAIPFGIILTIVQSILADTTKLTLEAIPVEENVDEKTEENVDEETEE